MRKVRIIGSIYLGCVIIVLTIIARCYPFTNEVISTNGPAYEQKVNSVAFGYQLEQQFIPIESGLSAIDIYVDTTECSTESGKLQFSIYDQDNKLCFICDIPLPELPEYGWYKVQIDAVLQKGKQYRIVLESVDCIDLGPQISFFAANQAAAPEQVTDILRYAGQEVPNAALRIKFYYEVPVKWYVYGVYVLFAVIVGLWIIRFWDKETDYEKNR